ncbi:ligand-binding sensor domain-containing protein [Chitinophaga arvensicola]|uniref:histidine kinase n=1 Tax=Chitinophaga arvensicola TaxID=29529 RepID=A0A1I0RG36_9BACT|nr:histidine kinase [Chitinophaga arvensicola]SEW39219.1 Histidine kinase [Chitinophaga arvensicola]
MRRILLCLLFFVIPLRVSADGILQFRHVKLPAGIGDAIVNNATIDSHGLLWFFNTSGLHRYDGNHLLTFDLVSTPSVIFNAITTIVIDQSDNLWIGTQSGLVFFDTHRWTTRLITPLNDPGEGGTHFIKRICIGSDGTIYTTGNNYKIYRVEKEHLVQIADLSDQPRADPFARAIDYIGEPVKNQLWVVHSGRLQCLERSGNAYTPGAYLAMPELKNSITPEVYFHPSGKIVFFAGKAGIQVFNPRTRQLTKVKQVNGDTLSIAGYIRFFLLPNGELGIYIRRLGVFQYDAAQDKVFVPENNIPANFFNADVTSVVTRDNKVYCSFESGVAELELTKDPFRNLLTTNDDPTAHSIRAIYKSSDSCLYVTSYKEGFIRLNEATGHFTPIVNGVIYRVLPWDDHRLLLATEGNGLHWYDLKTGVVTPQVANIPASKGQPDRVPRFFISIVRENDSLVWLGTYRGAFLLNIHTGIMSPQGKGKAALALQNSRINEILPLNGHCYFATINGLFDLDRSDDSVQALPVSQTTPDNLNTCYSIRLVNNQLWLGSNGRGIQIIDLHGKLIREIDAGNGLTGNIVYTLVQQGHWMIAGTEHGLSIIDTRNGQITSYSQLDHLPSNEFNHAAAAVYGDRVYMGTLNGITTFRVEDMLRYKHADMDLKVSLTNFSTTSGMTLTQHHNLPYLSDVKLEVPPGVDFFSLSFGGTDKRTDLLNYYYRIEEDGPWLEIGQQHDISIARITPGQYTFHLATRFPGQAVFKELLSVPLAVLPAFYETVWFRLLCILIVLLGIVAIFRYKVRQLLKEQSLRTKIAGDLHDEVGSTLTRIYFQADRLSALPEAPLMAKQIASSSREALRTMSDMVWSIDSRFDTAADLVSRMKDFISNLGDELDIRFVFNVTGAYAGMPLTQIIRQNYFQIFKEAVSNATRNASEPVINIKLHFSEVIALLISNTFPESEEPVKKPYQGGQGTYFMQQRSQLMKGELETWQEGQVYYLKLTVPVR